MPNGNAQQSEPGKWERIARLLTRGGARWAAAFGHPMALNLEQQREEQRKQAEQEEYQRAIQRRAETRAESREGRAQAGERREEGLYGLRRQQLGQAVREGKRKAGIAPPTYEEKLRRIGKEAEVKRPPVVPDVPNTYWEALLAKHKGDFAAALAEDLERKKGLRAAAGVGEERPLTRYQRIQIKQRRNKALADAEADFNKRYKENGDWDIMSRAERQTALNELRVLKQRIHDDYEGLVPGGKRVTVPSRTARPDPVELPKEGWLPDWLTGLFGGGQQPAPAPPITPTPTPQRILKTTPPPLPSVLTEDRVRVIDAQGNSGTIPRSQLEAALQQGYRVVE